MYPQKCIGQKLYWLVCLCVVLPFYVRQLQPCRLKKQWCHCSEWHGYLKTQKMLDRCQCSKRERTSCTFGLKLWNFYNFFVWAVKTILKLENNPWNNFHSLPLNSKSELCSKEQKAGTSSIGVPKIFPLCCVFRPAFGCLQHLKAGWNNIYYAKKSFWMLLFLIKK